MTGGWRSGRYGCKHDASVFDVVLREYCKLDPALNLIGDLCIDYACLNIPKAPPATPTQPEQSLSTDVSSHPVPIQSVIKPICRSRHGEAKSSASPTHRQ